MSKKDGQSTDMAKRGISLVGIKDKETVERIRKDYPDCYFELSYMSTPESLQELLPIIKGRVASIHLLAPVREYFPNLAAESAYEWSEREILKDAELALQCGAENLVLHPGYLVNGLVYSTYAKRLPQIQNAGLEKYMLLPEESVCSTEYITSELYQKAFDLLLENSLKLTEKIRALGLHLCLENLNPRAGYMILHPDEAIKLAAAGLDLCVDIGHLQVNAALFGFDVLTETKRLLDTGHVKTMHLHSNQSVYGTFKDSHRSLDRHMPYWQEVLDHAEAKGANQILEVLEEPLHNIGLLFQR